MNGRIEVKYTIHFNEAGTRIAARVIGKNLGELSGGTMWLG